MADPLVVLGIDPGLSRCGYGVVESSKGGQMAQMGARLISGGILTTTPDSTLGERLSIFLADIGELLDEFRPNVVAIERILFRKNAKTAFSVGQAVGLVHMATYQRSITVVEYSAAEVKLAVAGHGSATKFQVQRMIQLLANLDYIPSPPDVADAIALGLCHLAKVRGGRQS
ncbi:MAG: crossover junction endodeoxyribonuclease RuvC [Actinomycetota bacterium]|nr:crossover junction endodeoxyribonuclease RuvC [Actinomycetota bacterium]